MLDARRMQVLRVVVNSGSVGSAAKNLGYSPSAISQQLATLEKEAGTPLLEKAGRGVTPTPAGLLLAERAGALSSLIGETEGELADLRAGRTGRLRMRFFHTAGVGLVPPAMAKFGGNHPEVKLDLRLHEPEPLAELARGDADLTIFVVSREVPKRRGIQVTHLLDEPYHVVLPKQHPLCAQDRVELAELASESWVHSGAAPGPCQESLEDAFATAGFTPRFDIEANEGDATQAYVAAGLGVALLPQLGVQMVHPGVQIRPVRHPQPLRRIYIAVRDTVSEQPATLGLLRALHEVAEAAMDAQ